MLFRHLNILKVFPFMVLATACNSNPTQTNTKQADSVEFVTDSTRSQSLNTAKESSSETNVLSEATNTSYDKETHSKKVRTGNKAEEELEVDYKGRIDDDKAVMSLTFKGNKVSGSLRMLEGKKQVKLSGSVDEDGEIHLTGADNSKLTSTHHRRKRSFSGDYKKNGQVYHFRFRKGSIEEETVVDDIYQ